MPEPLLHIEQGQRVEGSREISVGLEKNESIPSSYITPDELG
jgi:hypothetical protein